MKACSKPTEKRERSVFSTIFISVLVILAVEALVAGIRHALLLPKPNTVAREYAERTLDKENVLRQFINDIRG